MSVILDIFCTNISFLKTKTSRENANMSGVPSKKV